eukprot:c28896_g5_i1 orf=629-2857(+)
MMGMMDSELEIDPTQQVALVVTSRGSTSGTASPTAVKAECATNGQFPAGLRVLVVDDDPICLFILDRMLRRCLYQVTTCTKATTALAMLRENKDKFDLVISDVYMPDMDGFKLLELVGLEMDLPVIMMSANGETSAVMKGITHGACDYLLKPVRIEELRNIWQHVVRKKWRGLEQLSGYEDKQKWANHDPDHSSPVYENADGSWKQSKKRKDAKEEEEEIEQDNEDPSNTKRPRVVWSVDLHQQFVTAVNQLGIDKAVPKRILELMNVQGLTRENVASHLQKYRLYLKRISGVAHQPGGMGSSFPGVSDSTFTSASGGSHGGLGDLRALAATGQLSTHVLMSTLQTGFLGGLAAPNNLGVAGVDPSLLLQLAAMQGINQSPLVRSSYGQTLPIHSPGNSQQSLPSGIDSKQLVQISQPLTAFGQLNATVDKGQAGMPTLQQQFAVAGGFGGSVHCIGVNSNAPLNANNNALMIQLLQQQAGGHSPSANVQNLTSDMILGQHMLSNDICGTKSMAPVSSVNSVNSNIGSEGSVPSVGQVGSDNQSLHLPGAGNGNISVPTALNVSPPLISALLENELSVYGMKASVSTGGGGISEGIPKIVGGMVSTLNSPTGMNHGLNVSLNNRQSWRGLGLGHIGQISSPTPSPRYSHNSYCVQGLNGPDHSLEQSLGFTGQTMSFINNPVLHADLTNPSSCITSHSEQLTADSDLKLRDGALDVFMGSKGENGFLPEHYFTAATGGVGLY